MTRTNQITTSFSSRFKFNTIKPIASMLSTKTFTLIIIIASLNRYHFCDAADVSDIRRLRIRAAMSDPIEESCKGSLDFNGFSKLDKICKDCFNLIREPEIYQLCRSGCFGTGYFYACMDTILLKAELKSEVANLLEDMHGQGDIKKK